MHPYAALCLACLAFNATAGEPLRLEVDASQAEAVLDIAGGIAAGRAPDKADWERLEGGRAQVRLRQREESLGRTLDAAAFRAFVASPTLLDRREALAATLAGWKRMDARQAAARARAYLPSATRLRATVYPVIKPATNSFVFDLRGDPAIFLYLDPALDAAAFENTVAHELHHVGVAAACPIPRDDARPAGLADTLALLGSFAEGRAVLAAAGGPDVHPHATGTPEARATWERDLALAGEDLPRMERFFAAVLDGELDEQTRAKQWMGFVNDGVRPQGPYYTLGWLMATAVERHFGRERLVASLCDPAAFLRDYDTAAAALNAAGADPALPRWSPGFLARLGG